MGASLFWEREREREPLRHREKNQSLTEEGKEWVTESKIKKEVAKERKERERREVHSPQSRLWVHPSLSLFYSVSLSPFAVFLSLPLSFLSPGPESWCW